MYLKIHINFINWWPTTLNISRRPTLLSCALKSMKIFYAISCEMIWQTTFSWKCVASSNKASQHTTYYAILAIQTCAFVWAWNGPWVVHGLACVPHGPTQRNKQTKYWTHQYLPKTRSSLYFYYHECNIGPRL